VGNKNRRDIKIAGNRRGAGTSSRDLTRSAAAFKSAIKPARSVRANSAGGREPNQAAKWPGHCAIGSRFKRAANDPKTKALWQCLYHRQS
jgi:hypothetical protein